MSTCPRFNHLLVLPHLRVQNANAVSSPLTHGFPSMTAFIGLMWALERKAREAGLVLEFNAVGVVCHDHQEQVTEGGFVQSFRLTRNPVERDGGSAAIIEEGRIHLDMSLILAVHAEHWDSETKPRDLQAIVDLVNGMRVAGGTLHPAQHAQSRRNQPWIADLTGDDEARQKTFRELGVRLLPGMALVARDDLLDAWLADLQVTNADANRLDAWLSLARVDWHYDAKAENDKGAWVSSRRKGDGWIVPIPVGYGALGELHAPGSVANARDASTPFRFVESLYSIGEWVGPHRLRSPQHLLWYADSQPDDGLYRCRNDYRPAADGIGLDPSL